MNSPIGRLTAALLMAAFLLILFSLMTYVSIPNRSVGYQLPLTEFNRALSNMADHETRIVYLEEIVTGEPASSYVPMAQRPALYKPISADWNQINRNADDHEARIDYLETVISTGLSDNYTSIPNRADSYEPPVSEWNTMNDNADDHETRLLALEGLLPEGLSGLIYWQRADLGVTKDGSNRVSAWANQGSGQSFSQATDANKPVWTDAVINGKPILRFDGSNDTLLSDAVDSAMSNLGGYTAFAVFRTDIVDDLIRDTWFRGLAGTSSENMGKGNNTYGGGAAFFARPVWTVAAPGTVYKAAMYSAGVFYYDTLLYNGGLPAADRAAYWHNGIAQTLTIDANSPASIPATNYSIGIGATPAPAGFWDGDIAEIIIYNRALTTLERQHIEHYLAQRYGL